MYRHPSVFTVVLAALQFFLFVIPQHVKAAEGLLPVFSDDAGVWGLMTSDGEVVVSPTYDEIEPLGSNRFAALENRHYVLLDAAGERLGQQRFAGIDAYNAGYAVAVNRSRMGLIDLQGNWILKPTYLGVFGSSSGFCLVDAHDRKGKRRTDRQCYFVKVADGEQMPTQFSNATLLSGTPPASIVQFESDAKHQWHILKANNSITSVGSTVKPPAFGGNPSISAICNMKGEFELIDSDGTVVAKPSVKCHSVRGISQGRFPVCVETRPIRKWGFLRRDGSVAIPPIYESVGDFTGGVAPVRSHGRWGLVDLQGAITVPCTYRSIYPLPSSYSNVFEAVDDDGFSGYLCSSGRFLRDGTPPSDLRVREDYRTGSTLALVRSQFVNEKFSESTITLKPTDPGLRETLYNRLSSLDKDIAIKEVRSDHSEWTNVFWLCQDEDGVWRVFSDLQYDNGVQF